MHGQPHVRDIRVNISRGDVINFTFYETRIQILWLVRQFIKSIIIKFVLCDGNS